jgi:hypothetical protein
MLLELELVYPEELAMVIHYLRYRENSILRDELLGNIVKGVLKHMNLVRVRTIT